MFWTRPQYVSPPGVPVFPTGIVFDRTKSIHIFPIRMSETDLHPDNSSLIYSNRISFPLRD